MTNEVRTNERREETIEKDEWTETMRELIELGIDGITKLLYDVEKEIETKEEELMRLRQEKCDLVIAMMRAQER